MLHALREGVLLIEGSGMIGDDKSSCGLSSHEARKAHTRGKLIALNDDPEDLGVKFGGGLRDKMA